MISSAFCLCKLEASASSGRSGLDFGRFVPGSLSSSLVLGRFVLGAPNPCSWILKWLAAARPTVAYCSWLINLRGYFVRGSEREIRALGEDIL